MNALQSTLHFLFPPMCTCCRSPLEDTHTTLCASCWSQLLPIDPSSRCPRCFHPYCSNHRCPKHLTVLSKNAICFEDSPALQTLRNAPNQIDALAGLLFFYWHSLSWPTPEVIVPTPGDWFSKKSWEMRKKISKTFSLFLHLPAPVLPSLQRDKLPIPHLEIEQQENADLSCMTFQPSVINKSVLIIHDELSTGISLSLTAQALLQYGASRVYGLSLYETSFS